MTYYSEDQTPCPKCAGKTHQESVDIGVGVIYGPRGCTVCGWSEDEKYDLSDGRDPIDAQGGLLDQFGNYYPPGNPVAAAYRTLRGAKP